MNELSPEARRLFRLARSGDEPSADALRRVESSIQARIATGAAIATLGTLTSKAAAGVTATIPWIKIVSSIGLAVTMGGAGWWGTHLYLTSVPQRHATTPANAAQQTGHAAQDSTGHAAQDSTGHAAQAVSQHDGMALPADTPLTGSELEPAEQTQTPLPQTRGTKGALSSNGLASTKSEDPLRAEIRDLRLAQQALRAGDGPQVLSLLSEQETAYSNGALQEERAAAKVLALCQMGRVAEARTSAEQFERRWPNSSLMARLRNSCWKP